jgi:hypothetical protein
MRQAYAKSGDAAAADFLTWTTYSTARYESATHGGRFVTNLADHEAYGRRGWRAWAASGARLGWPSIYGFRARSGTHIPVSSP